MRFNKEKVKKIIDKCTSLKDLYTNHATAYAWLRKNNLSKEMTSQLERKGNVIERFIYAYEFKRLNKAYVGITCDLKRRHKEHSKIGFNGYESKSLVLKLISEGEEYKLISDKKLYPVKEVIDKESKLIAKYKTDGWELLNIAKAGSLGSISKWTPDKCKGVADLCINRTNFNEKYPGAYDYAHRHKILDFVCENLPELKYWDKEKVINAINNNNCTGRDEFYRKHPGIFDQIKKFNLIPLMYEKIPNKTKVKTEKLYSDLWKNVKKVKSYSDFRVKYRNSYEFALRHNISNKLKDYYNKT